jgi:hypothetical protein
MKKIDSKWNFAFVIILITAFSLCGCSTSLEQQAQTVRVSPVSEEYKLIEKLEGKTYILLAETSTGQEQHRYSVSDSLARVLKEDLHYNTDPVTFKLMDFGNKPEQTTKCGISTEGLEVLSFTDLTNILNEKGLCQKHAEMKKFYQQNGMFRKTDLEFMANEIGADYLILPCLLDIRRWSSGRLSVVGVKLFHTQIASGMLSMEIWDTRKGHKVFSATSDVTIANESIKEKPIAMEEAFERAWLGIMKELPGQTTEINTVNNDEEIENISPLQDNHADSRNLKNEKETEFAKEIEISS